MAISPQWLTIYLYSAHRAVIFAIAQLSCEGSGGRRASSIVYIPWKERWRFPLPIMIDHCAISNHSDAICHQNVCDAQINSSLWVKILGCSLWSRSVMLGSAESEYCMLTNREIIFEVYQSTCTSHGQTDDRQTDRPSICRSNTAL